MFALVVKEREAVVAFEIPDSILPMLLKSYQVLSKSLNFCFLFRKMYGEEPHVTQWLGGLN